MDRAAVRLFSALILIFSLSCSSARIGPGRAPPDGQSNAHITGFNESHVSFEDRTEELVGHAERLIEKNESEGAVLDQRWYAFRRFGQHQELILGASQVVFYGGLEDQVRRQSENHYTSMVPLEKNHDPGEIRLFIGRRQTQYDFIIIGQNGREVALKTIIRLLYLAKFVDDETRRRYREKLVSFSRSLKVLMSSLSARKEFLDFFRTHGINRPDTVIVGFVGDSRALMKNDGIADAKRFSDESLRVNWYPDANGRTVLLVSIDANRIYASRAGELMEAILQISGDRPPSMVFLGSAGAIDEPALVGKIVVPTVVLKGDPFPAPRPRGVLVHIIRNRAVDKGRINTAHTSVENVVVETTRWARQMITDRIKTVDQELFHIIDAINSSADGLKVPVYAGILVTDNVSTDAGENTEMTLEHAEEMIAKTVDARREFLADVLTDIGILKHDRTRSPRQKAIAH
jgi:hypothetical protein